MDSETIFEIIGYAASALVAISLAMKRILYLRIVNLLGAITFVIYGLFIQAYPVVVVNGIITIINLYYLYQLFGAKEYFRLLEIRPDSHYLLEFLAFYREDIHRFSPEFNYDQSTKGLVFLVLRNMLPTGVFIGYQEGHQFVIELDYVVEGYRDFKSAQYIYRDSREVFAKRGIQQLITTAHIPAHTRYLARIGFRKQQGRYVLEL